LKTFQYSRDNKPGGGWRQIEHIQFFASDDAPSDRDTDLLSNEDDSDDSGTMVPMLCSVRKCAGVKTCEFFEVTPHTEVNGDSLEWAKGVAKQERSAMYAGDSRALTMWEQHKDETCTRQNLGGRGVCGGRTVIRSRNPTSGRTSCFGRLFIGCERYRPKDAGRHYIHNLDTFDPLEILKVWGRDRCVVHEDILETLRVTWDQIEGMISL